MYNEYIGLQEYIHSEPQEIKTKKKTKKQQPKEAVQAILLGSKKLDQFVRIHK